MDRIREKLLDEDSRIIYDARMKYFENRDTDSYMETVLSHTNHPGRWFGELLQRFHENEHNTIIWGCGNDGHTFMDRIAGTGLRPKLFCDRNPQACGRVMAGIAVVSPEWLYAHYDEELIIVATTGYGNEIQRELLNRGIPQDKICLFDALMNQYFDVFEPGTEEIFIDAGCFNGGTTLDFVKWCRGTYSRIYAFEPGTESIRQCRNAFRNASVSKVELINKGTWSSTGNMSFSGSGQGFSIDKNGTEQITVTSIDEVLDGAAASFIKMDVEGSELESLKGSRRTIMQFAPRLAICVYHKPEDILEIPEYILSLNSRYRFYLRHYSLDMRETVLYAAL